MNRAPVEIFSFTVTCLIIIRYNEVISLSGFPSLLFPSFLHDLLTIFPLPCLFPSFSLNLSPLFLCPPSRPVLLGNSRRTKGYPSRVTNAHQHTVTIPLVSLPYMFALPLALPHLLLPSSPPQWCQAMGIRRSKQGMKKK